MEENTALVTGEERQLPSNPIELARFVLVGEEKVSSLRAEIRAIKKAGLAKEVLDQKLQEAQEISALAMDAQVKLGELLLSIPKASGGDRKSEEIKIGGTSDFDLPMTKKQVVEELGIAERAAEDYQRMAQNPDIVKEVIRRAEESGDIVSRTQVMKEIKKAKDEARREALAEKQQEVDKKDLELMEVKKKLDATKEAVQDVVIPADYESLKYQAEADREAIKALQSQVEALQRENLSYKEAMAYRPQEPERVPLDLVEESKAFREGAPLDFAKRIAAMVDVMKGLDSLPIGNRLDIVGNILQGNDKVMSYAAELARTVRKNFPDLAAAADPSPLEPTMVPQGAAQATSTDDSGIDYDDPFGLVRGS